MKLELDEPDLRMLLRGLKRLIVKDEGQLRKRPFTPEPGKANVTENRLVRLHDLDARLSAALKAAQRAADAERQQAGKTREQIMAERNAEWAQARANRALLPAHSELSAYEG